LGEEFLGELGLGGDGEPGEVEGLSEVEGGEPGGVDDLGEEGGGGLGLLLGEGDEGVAAEALAKERVANEIGFIEGEAGGNGEELVYLFEDVRLGGGDGSGRGDGHLLHCVIGLRTRC
jgi:hypothetical protein